MGAREKKPKKKITVLFSIPSEEKKRDSSIHGLMPYVQLGGGEGGLQGGTHFQL